MADSPDVRASLLPSVEQISDSDDGVMEPEGSLPASRSHAPGSDAVPPTVRSFDAVTSTERFSGPCAGHASNNVLPPMTDVSESESFSPPCGLESPPHMRQKLDHLWRHSVPAPVFLGRILVCRGCLRYVARNEF